jgi:hypothetical protein
MIYECRVAGKLSGRYKSLRSAKSSDRYTAFRGGIVTVINTINPAETFILPIGDSRTGAKRQKYHAAGIAQREVGMKKRLSACEIV